MKKNYNIVLYLLGFILFAYITRFLGLVFFNTYELFAVVFAAYGAATVYSSMGENKKFALFIGTASFLAGVVFLLIGKQQIPDASVIIFPSVLFIVGVGCFILFIDNPSDKTLFLVSIIFVLLGVIYTTVSGSFNLSGFIISFNGIISEFWIIIFVVAIVIFLFVRGGKK